MANNMHNTHRRQPGSQSNQVNQRHSPQAATHPARMANSQAQHPTGTGSRSNPKPGSAPARSRAYRRGSPASRSHTWLLWLAAAIVIVGAAIWQISPRFTEPAAAMSVQLSMDGFQPAKLTIAAGQSVNVRLVNMDDSFHMDGGGVHEFAIPELGIDAKVDPRGSKVITIPAAKAGTYTFYCDVCCGGKENPSMRGTLTVS
jgi:cytochrome c oxidase subunit 2